MHKNRKVSRPAPVRPALPKNVRVTSLRHEASNRLTFWLVAAMFGWCSATAPLYVRFLVANELRFEAVVLWAMLAGLAGAYALGKSIAAWNELCDADEKIARSHEMLATVRSTRLH